MIRWWHLAVFGVSLVVAGAAFAPARFFFHPDSDGLAFEDARGSVWDATLTKASIGGLDAGDVAFRVSPADILLGRLVADVDLAGSNIIGNVRLQLGLGGERRLTTSDMRIKDFPVQNQFLLTGETRLSNIDLLLGDQACQSAQGILESDMLIRSADMLGARGPALSGEASCSGPAGRLTLAGERDGDAVELVLDLAGNGGAQWSLTYRTATPEVSMRLAAFGLEPLPETGAFGKRGAARWLPF